MEIKRNGTQPATQASADWFTGTVRIDPLFQPAAPARTAGACVTFEGWVRNHNEGKEVCELEYEGYEAVAIKEGEKVLAEARARFDLIDARCIHRVGRLAG